MGEFFFETGLRQLRRGLPPREFSDDVMQEAYFLRCDDELFKNRRLVRGITIDGPFSRDLDDAIWLNVHQDGGATIEVSIADVDCLVRQASATDQEAYARVVTRYLSNGIIPMIPFLLSEGRLSLLPGSPKPTITVIVELSAQLELLDIRLEETYFVNDQPLDYALADTILADPSQPLNPFLRQCQEFAAALLQRRRNRGALVIYDLKQSLFTDEEGTIKRILREESHHSHIIIQEFMILANEAVALFFQKHASPALFRNHTLRTGALDRERLLREMNDVLAGQETLTCFQKEFLCFLNRASYAPASVGHYGLNLEAYVHFTSPIRRYADLVNQRLAKALIHAKPAPYSEEMLGQMAEHLNSVIREVADAKQNYLRNKSFNEAQIALEYGTDEDFSEMPADAFLRVMKRAGYHGSLPPLLEQAILTRLEQGLLRAVDLLFLILPKKQSELFLALRQKAFDLFRATPHLATNALYILAQHDDRCQGVTFEVVEVARELFAAQALVLINNEPFSARFFAVAPNKKDAQNQAALNYLLDFCEERQVPFSQSVIPDWSHLLPAPESDLMKNVEDNYVGQCQDLCQKQGWPAPQYVFEQEGPAHQPLFTCQAQLLIGSFSYQSDWCRAASKKNAKQGAARDLLGRLEINISLELAATSDANSIGDLHLWCQQRGGTIPEYTYTQSGPSHQPLFTCQASVLMAGELYRTDWCEGRKKTEVKREAARQLLKILESAGHQKPLEG